MAISSLGIGSGVLTADILDQLREADEANVITPLKDKLTLSNQKEDAASLLSSLMTTLKSSTSSLSNDTLYLGRSVSGNTDALTVKAESGSDVQAFNITDIDKAEKDVWNSQTLGAKSTAIDNLGTGTLTVTIDGEDYAIEYAAGDSLNEIRDSINDIAGEKMTASVLEVGPDSYQLMITADNVNQAITFSDSNTPVAQVDTVTTADDTLEDGDTFSLTINGQTFEYTADVTGGDTIDDVNNELAALAAAYDFGSGAGNDFTFSTSADGVMTITAQNAGTAFTSSTAVVTDPSGTATTSSVATTENVIGDEASSLSTILSLNNIQPAEAATFKYNGIEITRSSNEISDLINGVTLTLNQNQTAEDSANISINQNDTAVSSEMSIFVNSYNSLISNLEDMTNSDRETGAVGIFNGDNFVKSIARELKNLVFSVNSEGNSLVDYGIEVDRNGVMSLDTAVLNEKIASDPQAMEKFFSGDSETEGIFTKLNNKLDDYTGFNKLLSSFSDRLSDEKERIAEQYDKRKASLDAQYEILTKKFTAYDAIISRINAQFESLKQMIDAQANAQN